MLQTRLNSVVDTSYHLIDIHKMMFRELSDEIYNNFKSNMTKCCIFNSDMGTLKYEFLPYLTTKCDKTSDLDGTYIYIWYYGLKTQRKLSQNLFFFESVSSSAVYIIYRNSRTTVLYREKVKIRYLFLQNY
jgi:hypothetical protein